MRMSEFRWTMIVIVCALLALYISWVGFIASDDVSYFRGAETWLSNPAFAGDDHWTTRFPVTISFAAFITIFGANFTAFAMMSVVWYSATIALVGVVATAIGGWRAGWIAALLAATTSIIVTNASIVNCDLPEAFLLLLGAFLVTRQSPLASIAAGLSWGLAALSRETAVLALAGLVPLFLIGRPLSRNRLLIAAAGVTDRKSVV